MRPTLLDVITYLNSVIPSTSGKGHIAGDQIVLIPSGLGCVIVVSDHEDSLLIQTGPGLRIGIGIDDPMTVAELAAPILGVINGGLTVTYRRSGGDPGFRLDYEGGALESGPRHGHSHPVTGWDK